jgi:predicted ribosome quality control (RQC) complex YloA/Tae2 family protein
MAFKTKRHLYSRKFLNNNRGLGAIECEIETSSYGGNSMYVDAGIVISDCYRRIQLDFGISEKKDVASKLAKIKMLIAELSKFETALEKAADEFFKEKSKPADKKSTTKKKSTTSKPAVIKSKL